MSTVQYQKPGEGKCLSVSTKAVLQSFFSAKSPHISFKNLLKGASILVIFHKKACDFGTEKITINVPLFKKLRDIIFFEGK
jgi:hypothetical protein